MAHHFFFLCPVCLAEDSIQHLRCAVCRTQFKFQHDQLVFKDQRWSFPDYFRWARENLKIRQELQVIKENLQKFSPEGIKNVVRVSREAELRQGLKKKKISAPLQLYQRELDMPEEIGNGLLIFTNEGFGFIGVGNELTFSYQDITCVTTNSHYFEFKVKGEPYYQINFKHESPLKYEVLFRKLILNIYARDGKKPIEFQPRLIFNPREYKKPAISLHSSAKTDLPLHSRIIRSILLFILRMFFRIFLKIEMSGKETLSLYSPFVCVLNHQSIFDPFIILAFLYQRIGFLTKSTSFARGIERYFLKLGLSIPTTRYQTDPEVIRHILNYLKRGIPVGIFPEGERSWDGQMQPFKHSVVRLLVSLKQPVIPINIENAFSFMPRWAKFPRKQSLRLTVRPAFCLVPDIYSPDDYKTFLESFFQKGIAPAE
jgi:1-acyl-sn-glycerol-3-phosphate acyltransferase